ncbi:MAG: lipopolysaccharide biosynthesis protein RfbH [Candidatus Brocadiae bacterium]|nr:lipopolysaccharide biosynthesis protein RfbH [Candidatus Brocadiia bacterium]
MIAMKEKEFREKILADVKAYYSLAFGKKKKFSPGDKICYAARVFDEEEIVNLVDSSLDFWLTAGRYASQFETKFGQFLGIRYTSLVNSGSSANLIAFMSLTSSQLGDRKIKRGDEVITVAATFPTTVAPVIQYGAIPVFVDVSLPSCNIDVNYLEQAASEKTKAVMIAHTLGNPFDLKSVKSFCQKHNLWLIEDNCDALGSQYCLDGKWVYTGTVGDIGTSSFYPPHHITMGEGGAVYTNDFQLKLIMESFRDWGRDCYCHPGKDDTCKNRFNRQFGELPMGYDHKYVYSHLGYNLKITDMQAAIGCAQLKKLPSFIKARVENWTLLREGLADLEDRLILPQADKNTLPSWFGFLITLKDNSGLRRDDIVKTLENKGIQTRMLFAGNIIKHPCFDEMRADGYGYRVVGDLKNTDKILNNSFWLGVYPGMTREMIDYMIQILKDACGLTQ